MSFIHLKGNSEAIRVGKIVCIGRNYLDHIRELGNAIPDEAILFIKPATSIIHAGELIRIPQNSSDCHHEVELAVLIGKEARDLSVDEAMEHVEGYGVAIDLTLRDVQQRCKEKGLPWEIAKGFDTACPLSEFVPASEITDPQRLELRMEVNGVLRQNGSTKQMLRSIPEVIAEMSRTFTLEPGDIILTGTPAGVSAITSGDLLHGSIQGVGELNVSVA